MQPVISFINPGALSPSYPSYAFFFALSALLTSGLERALHKRVLTSTSPQINMQVLRNT